MKCYFISVFLMAGVLICHTSTVYAEKPVAQEYKFAFELRRRAHLKEKTGPQVIDFLDALYRSDEEYLIRAVDLVLPEPLGERAFKHMTEGYHTRAVVTHLSSGVPACLIQLTVLYDKNSRAEVKFPGQNASENSNDISILFVKKGQDWAIEGLF